MRRKLPLFVMVGVTGVLVPVLAVLAQSSSTSCTPACCSQATCTASKPSAPSATDSKIIDELIAILKETKSEETFVVTAMALGRMGPEARRALPQLIRNAERLELFEDLFDPDASKGDREIAGQIAEAIIMLAGSNKDGQPMGYLSVRDSTAGAPNAYGSYGTPTTPAPSWNQPQPVVVPSAPFPCPTGSTVYPGTSTPPSPGYAIVPTDVPPASVPVPTRLPPVKKPSTKGSKAPAPVPPVAR